MPNEAVGLRGRSCEISSQLVKQYDLDSSFSKGSKLYIAFNSMNDHKMIITINHRQDERLSFICPNVHHLVLVVIIEKVWCFVVHIIYLCLVVKKLKLLLFIAERLE